RDNGDFLRFDLNDAQFGGQAHPPLLWHDEQFAISVIEKASLHGTVGDIQVNAHAALLAGASIAAPGADALDEIRGGLRDSERAPAQLIGSNGAAAKFADPAGRIRKGLERQMLRTRP